MARRVFLELCLAQHEELENILRDGHFAKLLAAEEGETRTNEGLLKKFSLRGLLELEVLRTRRAFGVELGF